MAQLHVQGVYRFLAGLIFAASSLGAQPISQIPEKGTVAGDVSGLVAGDEFIIYCPACPVHQRFSRNRSVLTSSIGNFVQATLVCREVDGTPAVSPLDTLSFDQVDGFVVTDVGSGEARIDLAAIPGSVLADAYLLDTTDTFTGTLTVAGTVAATTVTGANVTSGADPGHTHSAGTITTDMIEEADTNVETIDAGTGQIDFDVDGANRALMTASAFTLGIDTLLSTPSGDSPAYQLQARAATGDFVVDYYFETTVGNTFGVNVFADTPASLNFRVRNPNVGGSASILTERFWAASDSGRDALFAWYDNATGQSKRLLRPATIANTHAHTLRDAADFIPDAATHEDADHIDVITEIASALKTGADGKVVTGTAGATDDCAKWNVDGDLVSAGAACGSGGGGGFPREFYWTAMALLAVNHVDDAVPTADKIAGTNVDILVRSFSNTATQCLGGTLLVPADVDASGTVTFRAKGRGAAACTAPNCEVVLDFKHTPRDGGEAWDTALTTESSAATSLPTTSAATNLTEVTWTETVSNLAWAASDTVLFELCRDHDAAGDDLGVNFHLVDFSVEVPLA